MTNEQMKKIINYLIQIKLPTNTLKAIDMILNEIDDTSKLEMFVNKFLELGTEEPQIRGL